MKSETDNLDPRATPSSDVAKRNLLDTASSIDWLAPLRTHPFATVGVSAALGAIVASNPKSIAQATRFAGALLPVVEKATLLALRQRMNADRASPDDPKVETFEDSGGST